MAEEFTKDYWEDHWQQSQGRAHEASPYLARELGELAPGSALDAGCGEGAAAIWLALAGWDVTAVDISTAALAGAAQAATTAASPPVRWVAADLTEWSPGRQFDLVMTHYAHSSMPQLDFYARLAEWVAPGGTLLIVGHREAPADPHHHRDHSDHDHDHHDHSDHRDHRDRRDRHHDHGPGHRSPPAASVTATAVAARLDPAEWVIITAAEPTRTIGDRHGHPVRLDDVVVRASRCR